jgi:hypothetical protein
MLPPQNGSASHLLRGGLPQPLDRRRRLLGYVTLALLALLLLAWKQKGRLPSPSEIRPDLLQAPLQEATEREPFEFVYAGQTVRVRPVADYEIWGLVVSHNDIGSLADIYHDSSSVDTKDLCVVWGGNLQSGSLDKVTFESGPWTCYFSYPQGVRFDGREISNNHLVSDQDALREALAEVRVGDQIHVRGALVDYQLEDWGTHWRRSSKVRDDGGNGACEVLFFDEIEILARGTPFWYALFQTTRFLLFLVPLVFLHSIWIDSSRLERAAYRKPAFEGAAPEIWPGEVGK